jgi:hypothetical protein
MNINEITIGQAREIATLVNGSNALVTVSDHPYKIGENYFIRTVTYAASGKLISVGKQEIVLTDACWIADTGRFSEQWGKSGDDMFSEVEPFPTGEVIIGRGAVIDAVRINELPTKTKG